MKGKKISTRTLRLRGVGLIVTCAFGLLGAFPSGAQQKRNMEDRMATLTKPSNQADIPKIGYIRNVSKPTGVDEAFRRELLELGYVQDHNISIVERFAGRDPKTLKKSVDELLDDKVKIIVALDPPAARELLLPEHRTADRGIPMVIRSGSESEYNYKTPGKNITGMVELSNTPALFGKRLQLLKEVAKLSQIFLVWNPSTPPNATARYGDDGSVTKALKTGFGDLKINSSNVTDIGSFERFFKGRSLSETGLIVVRNAFILENKETIFNLAVKYKTPAIYTDREFVEDGGLLSYGTDEADLFRQAASYVDRILNGAKPEDLPMRQALRFELCINLSTAKRMGLKIPPTTLMLADKVVK
jgi:ABC-type uncharacterized transport system substrate-binding protein